MGEAGFAPEDKGASATALEIEYGLLQKDPGQRRRCLRCLREPLPCDRMPAVRAAVFSAAHPSNSRAPPPRIRRLPSTGRIRLVAQISDTWSDAWGHAAMSLISAIKHQKACEAMKRAT